MRSLFEMLNFQHAELWGGVVYTTLFLLLLPYLADVLVLILRGREGGE
jgi:hypothetical protein